MDKQTLSRRIRGPVIEIIVGILIALFTAWLFLSWLAGEAIGATLSYSPLAYNECLPRALEEVTEHLSSEGREALSVLDTNRSVVDCVPVSDRETALGVFHITAQAERFYPGPLWEQLAVLYSDAGPARQAAVWRRLVHPVRAKATDSGCHGECLVTVLALANSAPYQVMEWGENVGWDPEALCEEYQAARPNSEHRARRCRRLGL